MHCAKELGTMRIIPCASKIGGRILEKQNEMIGTGQILCTIDFAMTEHLLSNIKFYERLPAL